ncbi:GNAT family N-acetyltransferase [Devosia albogilva]|uniref:GNAT family N-acetyltransferase n=1 Tax=Devosia albogilva TaxID=429726 RepID=A0ABW5QJN2_9HYPH
MKIVVRRASEADAPEMSRILIASITELCSADHHDDPSAIAAWTANKSEAGVLAMMALADSEFYVAERDSVVLAVGAIQGDTIGLNYVDPQHRRMGVSRALMLGLEDVLRNRGVAVARLKSTATAHDFYKALGWSDVGPAAQGRFISAYPMRKVLSGR